MPRDWSTFPEWIRAASKLTAVAAGSFILGWWSARRCDKGLYLLSQSGEDETLVETATKGKTETVDAAAKTKATLPAEVQPRVSSGDLLKCLEQLRPKPIGSSGREVHSTAKVVIVCASGKGGVGKSTVSVNLAYMLSQMGLDVGLLDLDIYGPSLPVLVKSEEDVMQSQAGRPIPIDYAGVKLMSYGYINPEQATTIRAPILNQIVTTLVTTVEWGALDVLLIDSPPGTGDVLMTLSQALPVDGAVIVTTSNHISFADVVKGVQLFEQVEIPPMVVVANMSCIRCCKCGHRQDLFADQIMGTLPDFLTAKGVGLVELPLDPLLSEAPSTAMPSENREYPFVRNPSNEARPAWKSFNGLAHVVLEALLGAGSGSSTHRSESRARLKLRPRGTLELRLPGGDLKPVQCCELRATCRCAHCIDEVTGTVKIDRERIRRDKSLRATKVHPMGNYAVLISWSDGHESLIATKAVEQMVTGGSTGRA